MEKNLVALIDVAFEKALEYRRASIQIFTRYVLEKYMGIAVFDDPMGAFRRLPEGRVPRVYKAYKNQLAPEYALLYPDDSIVLCENLEYIYDIVRHHQHFYTTIEELHNQNRLNGMCMHWIEQVFTIHETLEDVAIVQAWGYHWKDNTPMIKLGDMWFNFDDHNWDGESYWSHQYDDAEGHGFTDSTHYRLTPIQIMTEGNDWHNIGYRVEVIA
ncbi:MAG: hypothetical protein KHX13_04760 [Acidaminococcus intestini]|uniref:Uncharacterized protein n=1 Tax=Acidaminococcus intestini TaxID=187327 RepID=A0A943ECF9_9FIRM|nr:hypothetical protein [Acidaminococcus intestini]